MIKVAINAAKIYEGESVAYQVLIDHVENPPAPELKALESRFRRYSLATPADRLVVHDQH